MQIGSIGASATAQKVNVDLIKSSREQEKAVVGTILKGIEQNANAVTEAVRQSANPHLGSKVSLIA